MTNLEESTALVKVQYALSGCFLGTPETKAIFTMIQ